MRNFLIATAFTRIESTSLPSADREREQFSWIRTPPTNKRLIKRIISFEMSGFKPVELFGGAITADFPAAFGDVR